MAKQRDVALGSWEASCLLGVHWTQAAKMAEKGLLTRKDLKSPIVSNPARVFSIYSRDECEKDFADYEEKMRSGGTGRRARTAVGERMAMLKKLAAIPDHIDFDDAISTGEASEILRVHWTFPPRMAAEGKIRGRILINERNKRSRCWIFSRASCKANVVAVRKLEAAGKKRGRVRST
jgi:hypothetical protein